MRRHLTTCNLCPICVGYEETLLHTFRDCYRINLLWNFLQIPNPKDFYTTQNWKLWLETNLKAKKCKQGNQWSLTFGFVLQNIWRSRNEVANHSTPFKSILIRAEDQVHAMIQGKIFFHNLDPLNRNKELTTSNNWLLPLPGFVAVSVYASI